MWLPKPAYEALPFILLTTGLLLGVGSYLSSAGWLLIIAGLVAVAGLVLYLKRRDYRLSRSRIKYDHLD
jgi:type II secretory pathway component PulF